MSVNKNTVVHVSSQCIYQCKKTTCDFNNALVNAEITLRLTNAIEYCSLLIHVRQGKFIYIAHFIHKNNSKTQKCFT